jgi:hypothetical protein
MRRRLETSAPETILNAGEMRIDDAREQLLNTRQERTMRHGYSSFAGPHALQAAPAIESPVVPAASQQKPGKTFAVLVRAGPLHRII